MIDSCYIGGSGLIGAAPLLEVKKDTICRLVVTIPALCNNTAPRLFLDGTKIRENTPLEKILDFIIPPPLIRPLRAPKNLVYRRPERENITLDGIRKRLVPRQEMRRAF